MITELFSLKTEIILGTPQYICMIGSPDILFRSDRVSCNAPSENFVLIDEIRIAMMCYGPGESPIDAYQLRDAAYDTISFDPTQRVTLIGKYTGHIPPAIDENRYIGTPPEKFPRGEKFSFIFTFHMTMRECNGKV